VIIDSHAHLLPPERMAKLIRWTRRFNPFHPVPDSVTLEELLQEYADARVDECALVEAPELARDLVIVIREAALDDAIAVQGKMQQHCLESGIPVWCGGMLEAGVGRAHNIAMSTLPGFTLPGDVSASRRYWAEDIIEPEVEVSPRGAIRAPAGPGIGFEPRRELIERLTLRREELS